MYRVHIVKAPSTRLDFFPYSHYSDNGHDPQFVLKAINGVITLSCTDLFKLKPNFQNNPKDRIDIYMPFEAALAMALALDSASEGANGVISVATADPEDFRTGRQTLPKIKASTKLTLSRATVAIAGITMMKQNAVAFVDNESPEEGHIEMKGPEVHIGIMMAMPSGALIQNQIQQHCVPINEIRRNETNPVNKASGSVVIELNLGGAKSLSLAIQTVIS